MQPRSKWLFIAGAVCALGLGLVGLVEAASRGLLVAATAIGALSALVLVLLGVQLAATPRLGRSVRPSPAPQPAARPFPPTRTSANEPRGPDLLTDPLTGLHTHRRFQERLIAETERVARNGGELTLLLVDVDDFHHYNQHNGYAAGDRVLARLGELVRECLREKDEAARFGGEELALLLPGTGERAAAMVAETIRVAVAGETFAAGERQPSGQLTVSVGVACLPRHASDAVELLAEVDRALFLAKARGRDRVVVAPPPSERSAAMASLVDVDWSDRAPREQCSSHAPALTRRAPGTLRGPGPAQPSRSPDAAPASDEPAAATVVEPLGAPAALGDGSTTLVSEGVEADRDDGPRST